MGGVAGHMDHLYDNPILTFTDMKNIMAAASNGELDAEEKVDGQNLCLSYSIPEGKAKGARNKGHYRTGGLDAAGLATKFANRGGLTQAFTGGFDAFERAVESLSDAEKEKIFGPDANIWYNAEVMDPGTIDPETNKPSAEDPGATNVIRYDNKTLKIHDVGHFRYDPDSNSEEPIPEGALETLDAAYDRMQNSLKGHNFQLARRAIIQLQKLEDDEALNLAVSKIDRALAAEGLSSDATVGDYVFSRVVNGIDSEVSTHLKEEIAAYLLKLPGSIGLRELRKAVPPNDQQDLQDIVTNRRSILSQAIEPIEMIVHDFTVEILKGLQSVFIANTENEVKRLKDELAKAVQEITASGNEDPERMAVMQRHLNKIKDFSQITTPVEAIVFDYDGHTYKFAGNYAPLNQILGMFKYPKGGKKVTTESLAANSRVITDKEGKRIALIPGGFKPPHAGHFMLAKHFANKKDVDEVRVIVSTKSRPPVTVDMAIRLWELYTKEFPKIIVQAGTTASPVGDVYELVADNSVFQEGDVALLGKSEKDADDTRFDRAQSYAERKNPGVKVESVITPLFAGGVSGTQMRSFITAGDKSSFMQNLPPHLDKEDKEEAWEVVSDIFNESLDNVIDSTLEEISSCAGGSVSGVPGGFGFGPPNRYNPYKTSKRSPKKPQVKRAKRQRRR